MSMVPYLQWAVVIVYVIAAVLLSMGDRWQRAGIVAVVLTVVGLVVHLGILQFRWQAYGQLPIVTRYEDMTVDALMVVAVYLFAQWRIPWLRRTGLVVLPMAALGLGSALAYSMGSAPRVPALRTNWLIIHSQLNSLAIGAATLAAAAALFAKNKTEAQQAGRLLAWAFLFWAAMVAAGSYWASLAWGRFWGWDPIESWALGTLLCYAFVLHLRIKPGWRGRRGLMLGLVPYGVMLFTTYGLLLVRGSIHGSYLFQ
jgi:ABC-type transport system involved in cytochrome c biogenesis permease subunit